MKDASISLDHLTQSIERNLNSTYAISNLTTMIMLQYYDKIAYGENVW